MYRRGRAKTRTQLPNSQLRAISLYTNGFMKTKSTLTLPHSYMHSEFLKRYAGKLTVVSSGEYDSEGGERGEKVDFYFAP